MTWTEVYTRCMDGEFFHGPYCPRDGSTMGYSLTVTDLVARIREDGKVPSLPTLIERGYDGPLDKVIIVQFASQDDVPDLLWFG